VCIDINLCLAGEMESSRLGLEMHVYFVIYQSTARIVDSFIDGIVEGD
jgi:hypothetical protein